MVWLICILLSLLALIRFFWRRFPAQTSEAPQVWQSVTM